MKPVTKNLKSGRYELFSKTLLFTSIIIFLLSSSIQIVAAPGLFYEAGTILNVLSIRGLNLRAKPNKNSKILESLSFGDSVRVVSKTDKEYEIDEVKGYWVKVNYEDRIGFIFDGFLSRYPAPLDSKKRKGNFSFKEYYQNYLDGLKNASFTSGFSEDGSSRERLVLPRIRLEEAIILASLLTTNFDKYKISRLPIALKNGDIDVMITPTKDKEDNLISYEIKESTQSGNSASLTVQKLENDSVEIIYKFRSP